jgi:site-specific DNA recombinase
MAGRDGEKENRIAKQTAAREGPNDGLPGPGAGGSTAGAECQVWKTDAIVPARRRGPCAGETWEGAKMKAEQGRRRAALYARYSTDKQSEMSVEDQFRVSERIANREGFEVVARFEDRAITGGTSARPGYQAMLSGARLRQFDAIIAEDLKRLWREQAEQWRCIKELLDLDMCVITASGVDSRQPNFEIIASVIGAAAELDRKEASYRTRRGLEGLAVAGKSTGGKAYGYVAARDSDTGQVEIKEAEAAVVTRIFEMYASGLSPRSIAGRLNAEGVPSPGASWFRKSTGQHSKRRSKWVASAIHGDVRRGSGILNNERYIGRMNWGRSHWKRGAADSSKRVNRLIDDRSQWVTHEEPRLRIISDELWNRVRERQAIMAAGAVCIRAARTGRPAASLLSGLLVCASCGSRFIAARGGSHRSLPAPPSARSSTNVPSWFRERHETIVGYMRK